MNPDTQRRLPVGDWNLVAAATGRIVSVVIPAEHTQAEWVVLWRELIAGARQWHEATQGVHPLNWVAEATLTIADAVAGNPGLQAEAMARPRDWMAEQLAFCAPERKAEAPVVSIAITGASAALAAGIAEIVCWVLGQEHGLRTDIPGWEKDPNTDAAGRLLDIVKDYRGSVVSVTTSHPATSPPA